MAQPAEHFRPDCRRRKKERRLGRIQPVQHVQPVCDGDRRAVRNVSFDPIRQESRRADRFCADRNIHGLVHIPARGRNRRDVRPGILPRAVLCSHDSAALGHVCRCRGLRGMENGTPHYRCDLCNHHVRSENRAEPGRRHGRLAFVRLWLSGPTWRKPPRH